MAEDRSYAHGEFCWHEIATRDAAAAKRFYEGLLGWRTEDVPMPDGGTYTMARAGGEDAAGIWPMAGAHLEGVPAHWASYVWVDDVDAAVAKARGLGAAVIAAPMDIGNGGRFATLRDPQGAVFSVYKGAERPGAGRAAMAPGTVGWNELMTTDVSAAKAFYGALFGWTGHTAPTPGGGDMEYTTCKVGDAMVAGMMAIGPGPEWAGIPPHWMPYVSVADCAACAEAASGLGGALVHPANAIPGVGTFAVLADPSGATFSVMQWAPPAA